MSEPTYEIGGTPQKAPSSGSSTPIIFGLVALVLAGVSGYEYYQLGLLRTEIAQDRESLMAEISKVHETTTISTQTS